MSGTFCEELALRVLRTKGTGHLFPAQCLDELQSEREHFERINLTRPTAALGSHVELAGDPCTVGDHHFGQYLSGGKTGAAAQ